ncbi:AmmeMemoRadiSam system protein B [Hwanghaeella grinnelliae]|uniref:MEMO1 family protein EOI86_21925 n=1 Tax=Hwanghaeella grinnelliae TaxID=2500179 RepID=A0A437QGX1_9PROT|nr:AmmeMemoRadiSam system protein B [Hwanghaeella grinnelliae]RVU33801.1 AmmeMemoRadiSam system protein B [Hwanghaeella grinnelliae]
MAIVRPPAVAGVFYPRDGASLNQTVGHLLQDGLKARQNETGRQGADLPAPKALIAPHAGYVFSGIPAARAYAELAPIRDRIERVVLLGPAHRVALRGLATTSADTWQTPLGPVPIDRQAIDAIAHLPQVTTDDNAHAQEHCLEVHLPFLQRILSDFSLVPFVVGAAGQDEVAEVLETLWGGPETLILISSDLSHYHPYSEAIRLDTRTAQAIESLDETRISQDQACGRIPISGLLSSARRHHLQAERVALCNSGDTSGDKSRVVGYGAWVFRPEEKTGAAIETGTADPGEADQKLLDRHGRELMHLMANTIRYGFGNNAPPEVAVGSFNEALRQERATFVTLESNGQLRGCIGSIVANRPLVLDVVENTFRAAFRDPRFPRLTPGEIHGLKLSLSILSPMMPMQFDAEADLLAQLRPGEDGLMIQDTDKRSVFLPQVWEQLPNRRDFLSHLKAKAGMVSGHWSSGFKAWRFTVRKLPPVDFAEAETAIS